MKKIYLLTLLSFAATFSYAQWTPNSAGTILSTTNAIGISTTSPASALSVNGGVSIGTYAATQAAPTNGLAVSGNVSIGTTFSTYGIELGAPYAGNIDQGLRITSGTTSTLNAIRFGIKSNSVGAYRGAISFSYNGGSEIESISIADTSGFVGIGTTLPTQALSIVGNETITGNILIPSMSVYTQAANTGLFMAGNGSITGNMAQ